MLEKWCLRRFRHIVSFSICATAFCAMAAASSINYENEPIRKVTPASELTRKSGESDEQFQARKDRGVYGTKANIENCREDRFQIGRCKGRNATSCLIAGYYKGSCIGPGQNADDEISKIPPVDNDQYYDFRDGMWITHGQYCRRLANLHGAGTAGAGIRSVYESAHCVNYVGP